MPDHNSNLVTRHSGLREAKKTADTTFDRIYKYYFGKKAVELSEKQEAIRDRWEKAYAMLCDMKTPRKVAAMLHKLYGVDPRTGYNDIRNSMMLFGDPQIGMKSAKRAITNEWITKGIEKAWKDDDMQSYDRLISRYININGISSDQDNPIADLLRKLKPTKIEFSLEDPDKLKKEADKLMRDVEDIDHEEIFDEDED